MLEVSFPSHISFNMFLGCWTDIFFSLIKIIIPSDASAMAIASVTELRPLSVNFAPTKGAPIKVPTAPTAIAVTVNLVSLAASLAFR